MKKIQATLPAKLQVWGPRLGANAPTDVPVPDVMTGNTIMLEGQTLRNRGVQDDSLPHRSYVWIPLVEGHRGRSECFRRPARLARPTRSLHRCEPTGAGSWTRWQRCSRPPFPATCCPGKGRLDSRLLSMTRFESELAKARDSAALIEAMKSAYPQRA